MANTMTMMAVAVEQAPPLAPRGDRHKAAVTLKFSAAVRLAFEKAEETSGSRTVLCNRR